MAVEPVWAPGVVVFGVAGCGKTTLGRALAERIGARFIDADDHHPAANVALMRAGAPLSDADREPWLEALAAILHGPERDSEPLVLACSALRRSYRDRLRGGSRPLRWIFLDGDRATLAGRLQARCGHFFAPGLLDSQLETLEAPDGAEGALRLDPAMPLEALVDAAVNWLKD